MRGFDVGVFHEAEIGPTLIIGEDENDVGAVLFFFGGRQAGVHPGGAEYEEAQERQKTDHEQDLTD